MVDQKDPLTLIKSLKIVKKKVKFRCLIIGRGIYLSKIKSFLIKNKISKQFKLLNWQKNPFKYLNYSDMLILTSKYEGLPNVLLEASSLKKFIISSNCKTGPKEILDNGKGGMLFEIGNHIELSKKIIKYSKNKKKYKKNIRHAYKRLYRFDYNKNLNMYLKTIQKEINN